MKETRKEWQKRREKCYMKDDKWKSLWIKDSFDWETKTLKVLTQIIIELFMLNENVRNIIRPDGE